MNLTDNELNQITENGGLFLYKDMHLKTFDDYYKDKHEIRKYLENNYKIVNDTELKELIDESDIVLCKDMDFKIFEYYDREIQKYLNEGYKIFKKISVTELIMRPTICQIEKKGIDVLLRLADQVDFRLYDAINEYAKQSNYFPLGIFADILDLYLTKYNLLDTKGFGDSFIKEDLFLRNLFFNYKFDKITFIVGIPIKHDTTENDLYNFFDKSYVNHKNDKKTKDFVYINKLATVMSEIKGKEVDLF